MKFGNNIMIKILITNSNLNIKELNLYKQFFKQRDSLTVEIVNINLNTEIGFHLRQIDDNIKQILICNAQYLTVQIIEELIEYSESTNSHAIFDICSNDQDYVDIITDLVFINVAKLRQLELFNEHPLDWGDPIHLFEQIWLHLPKQINSRIVLEDIIEKNNIRCGEGWILLQKLFRLESNIRIVPESIKKSQAQIGLQNFNINSEQVNLSKTVISQSMFNNTKIENVYITNILDFKALSIILHYTLHDQCRIIALSNNVADDKTLFYNIINNRIDNIPQNILDNYLRFVGENPNAQDLLEKIKNLYVHFFNSNEFFEDVDLSVYSNNLLWLGKIDIIIPNVQEMGYNNKFLEIWYADAQNTVRLVHNDFTNITYKDLKVTLINNQSQDTLELTFNIRNKDISQKWARYCHYDFLNSNLILEKNYMLHNWQYRQSNLERSIPILCHELNRHIANINNFFDGSSDLKPKYHIPLHFDHNTLDQDILNDIHHHFELLVGQVWNPSEYLHLADDLVNESIRALNNICHEIESLRHIKNTSSCIIFSVPNIPTYKFSEQDFDEFTRIQRFGNIILFYAQLGKTPIEAYRDEEDDKIGDENISGNRYNSGQFIITLPHMDIKDADQLRAIEKVKPSFDAWLRSKGQDPDSKFTGVGHIVLADFDRTKYSGLKAEEILDILYDYDDVLSIELTDINNNCIKKQTFEYTWRTMPLIKTKK